MQLLRYMWRTWYMRVWFFALPLWIAGIFLGYGEIVAITEGAWLLFFAGGFLGYRQGHLRGLAAKREILRDIDEEFADCINKQRERAEWN